REMTVDDMCNSTRLALDGALAQHENRLKAEELVESQSLARRVGRWNRLGKVHVVHCPSAINKIETITNGFWQWVRERSCAFESFFGPLRDLPSRQTCLLRLRIDGNYATRTIADEVDNGIRHLATASIEVDLSEKDSLTTREELLGAPGLIEK